MSRLVALVFFREDATEEEVSEKLLILRPSLVKEPGWWDGDLDLPQVYDLDQAGPVGIPADLAGARLDKIEERIRNLSSWLGSARPASTPATPIVERLRMIEAQLEETNVAGPTAPIPARLKVLEGKLEACEVLVNSNERRVTKLWAAVRPDVTEGAFSTAPGGHPPGRLDGGKPPEGGMVP